MRQLDCGDRFSTSVATISRFGAALGLVGVLGALGSCATYKPLPMEDQSPFLLDTLQTQAASLKDDGRYEVTLFDGLDLTEVGILAVFYNPGLKQLRAQARVVDAQAFAAGLLPDPQFAGGIDKPRGGNTAGLVDAWSSSLGYDIVPLITRQSVVASARKQQEKVRLDVLWQEWQVIQQARSLAVRLQLQRAQLALLRDVNGLYLDRYRRSAEALKEGDLTLDVTGTDLTALLDTSSQITQVAQAQSETRHAFCQLLGIDPESQFALAPLPSVPSVESEVINERVDQLASIRPDLLALKAGYESQEERVRAAVLAQFPSLGVSVNAARDTGDVKTFGLGISLNLPLFNGNRGNIAVERATRNQLIEEYRARLVQTRIDVNRLQALRAILDGQLDTLRTYLPSLQTLVDSARRAYAQGDIDALTFLNMESTWVGKRLEQLSLTQAAWETSIALQALLALPGHYPSEDFAADRNDPGGLP